MRKLGQIGVLLTALLACKSGQPGEPSASSASARSPNPPAPAPLPQASTAASTETVRPSAPEPGAPKAFGQNIKAEPCAIHGREFRGNSATVIRDIDVVGSHLLVTDFLGRLARFNIDEDGPCQLRLDTSFGKQGVLELGVDHLSHDDEGNLVGSSAIGPNGTSRTQFITEAGSQFTCDNRGYVALHADGKWAISHFTNTSLGIVDIDRAARSCRRKEWGPVAESGKLKRPFWVVTSVRVIGDEVYVGGEFPESVNPKRPNVVRVYDKAGRELRGFGSLEPKADDAFEWVSYMGLCSHGLCVHDENRHRISVWQRGGDRHLGNIDLKQLLGAKFGDFSLARDPDGQAFYVAGTESADGGEEGRIYRLTGL